MQHQIRITPQPLTLDPVKDTARVNEINYTTDFDNFPEWVVLINFFKLEKFPITC